MDFGQALHHLRNGDRVAREGWNGKGMFLILVPGSTIPVSADRPLGKAAPELVDKTIEYLPHIDMFTAQGALVPWLASQTDVLATDWDVVKTTEQFEAEEEAEPSFEEKVYTPDLAQKLTGNKPTPTPNAVTASDDGLVSLNENPGMHGDGRAID